MADSPTKLAKGIPVIHRRNHTDTADADLSLQSSAANQTRYSWEKDCCISSDVQASTVSTGITWMPTLSTITGHLPKAWLNWQWQWITIRAKKKKITNT